MKSIFSVVFVVLLFGLSAVFCLSKDAAAESPCPSKFRYSFRSPPVGLLDFTLNEVLDDLEVKVKFSAVEGADEIGPLEFIGDKDVRMPSGEMKRKLKYTIKLPDVTHLPKLTRLVVNGAVRCRGPPYSKSDFKNVKTVTRKHDYFHYEDDGEDYDEPTIKKKKTKKPSILDIYGDDN